MTIKVSKKLTTVLVAILTAALALFSLAGCGSSSGSTSSSSSSNKTIKVGASPTPHAEILNHI